MIKSMVPGSSEENMWIKKLKHHLDEQQAHRKYCYTNRSMSTLVEMLSFKAYPLMTGGPLMVFCDLQNDCLRFQILSARTEAACPSEDTVQVKAL
jgi:hypothetical protein